MKMGNNKLLERPTQFLVKVTSSNKNSGNQIVGETKSNVNWNGRLFF